MEKIKCPYCGQEINANSKFCPNCGSSLEEYKSRVNNNASFNAPSPKDPDWMKKWKTKSLIWRCIFGFIFLFFGICLIYCLPATLHPNIDTVDRGAFGIVCVYGTIISLIIFIDAIVVCRVSTATLDGYNIVISSGLYVTLVVEDVILWKKTNQAGGLLFRRYLPNMTGVLPNNKKFVISYSSSLSNPDIRFVDEVETFKD